MRESAIEYAKKFLQIHPAINECLQNGLINYSQVVRFMNNTEHSFDALLIALRRISRGKNIFSIEKIHSLLKKTSIQIESKKSVFILQSRISLDILFDLYKFAREHDELVNIIQSSSAIIIISNFTFSSALSQKCKPYCITKHDNLSQITLISPKNVESIKGAVAYIYTLLAQQGINVVETLSCWTDTIILVKQSDQYLVMEVLDQLL